jgi:hypothetical protein
MDTSAMWACACRECIGASRFVFDPRGLIRRSSREAKRQRQKFPPHFCLLPAFCLCLCCCAFDFVSRSRLPRTLLPQLSSHLACRPELDA